MTGMPGTMSMLVAGAGTFNLQLLQALINQAKDIVRDRRALCLVNGNPRVFQLCQSATTNPAQDQRINLFCHQRLVLATTAMPFSLLAIR